MNVQGKNKGASEQTCHLIQTLKVQQMVSPRIRAKLGGMKRFVSL